MARHYKFHKWYAVVYLKAHCSKFTMIEPLTKKEARMVRDDLIKNPDVIHVEITKRIDAWCYEGRIEVEAL